MTTDQFRFAIKDGTRIELTFPEGHRAYDLNGKSAVVLRCLGCADEKATPEKVDYLVKVDGRDDMLVIPARWIIG